MTSLLELQKGHAGCVSDERLGNILTRKLSIKSVEESWSLGFNNTNLSKDSKRPENKDLKIVENQCHV